MSQTEVACRRSGMTAILDLRALLAGIPETNEPAPGQNQEYFGPACVYTGFASIDVTWAAAKLPLASSAAIAGSFRQGQRGLGRLGAVNRRVPRLSSVTSWSRRHRRTCCSAHCGWEEQHG
jgi:hypothetical protein